MSDYNHTLIKLSSFALATVLMVALAIQYPLSTTFPIGGDAVRYAARADQVANTILESPLQSARLLASNSNYPGAIALLATSKILPISWPERIVWWTVLGHIATGLALAWLLYLLSGWRSATTGLAIWALTTTGITRHFEDGTLAQLLSLPVLLLFFACLATDRRKIGILLAVLLFTIHPLTSILMLLTLLFSLPSLLFFRQQITTEQKRMLYYLLGFTGIITIIIFFKAPSTNLFFRPLPIELEHFSIPDLARSVFGPFLIIAPAGIFILAKKLKQQVIIVTTLLTFFMFSILLAYNDVLNIGLFTQRFHTYFILSLTITSALAYPKLIALAFSKKITRTAFTILLFLTLGAITWQNNAYVYNFYETPHFYARIHPEELEAIQWMQNNLTPNSFVVSSKTNRHTEWIPILTDHRWQGLDADNAIWHKKGNELDQYLKEKKYTHLIFFKHREDIADAFQENPPPYPTVFSNDATLILQLNKAP